MTIRRSRVCGWFCGGGTRAGRRFERDEPDSDWLFEPSRPLNWFATLSFWFWALGRLVMLAVLLALCPQWSKIGR